MDNRPIGIFDTGYGGLTVLKEVCALMPSESIVYLGDTKNAPYSQYPEEICVELARKCLDFLQTKDCKAYIVACNLMSGIALPMLKERANRPIVGMIDAAAAMVDKSRTIDCKNVGIIGSQHLTESGIYQDAIREKLPDATIQGVGTAELARLVERGILEGPEAEAAVRWCKDRFVGDLDMLVLGCTHYPMLRKTIQNVFGEDVILVDPATMAAKQMQKLLTSSGGLCDHNSQGRKEYYTSADPSKFRKFMSEILGLKSDHVYHAVFS